jgi:hypothetical protein
MGDRTCPSVESFGVLDPTGARGSEIVPERRGASPSVALGVFERDCLRGMRALPTKSVDVVVTSPPYNLGKAYREYDDNRTRKSYSPLS